MALSHFLQSKPVKSLTLAGISALLSLVYSVSSAQASELTLFLSTQSSASLNGTNFRDGDILEHGSSTSISFSESNFINSEDIDGLHITGNGTLILSTNNNASLGGVNFRDGDIVSFNPNTGIATVLFSEDNFRGNEEVDAIFQTNDGRLLMSTSNTAEIDGTTFSASDIFAFDPATGSTELFFSAADFGFSTSENIDAFHVLDSGNFIFSTSNNATIDGVTFRDGDLIEFDPITGIATLFQAESEFSSNEDIDAIFIRVPVPAAALLMMTALIGLHRRRRA